MARTDQPHKLAFDAFVAKCTDFNDPINSKHFGLDYSRPETRAAWNGSKSKIPIWCLIHDEFFVQMAANHMVLGHGCPKCGKDLRTKKKTKRDPIADFRKTHGDKYDYSRVLYTNNKAKIEIVCPEHGPFMQVAANHANGEGCPECWQVRQRNRHLERTKSYSAEFAERAAKVHGGIYEVLSAPAHSHDFVTIKCATHGTFEQRAYSHLAGIGCPSCGKGTSYAQQDLAAFVESLGVEVEHDNRTVLGGQHIDVWVPSRGIGIEYHGSYWHTVDRAGDKHRRKWELAQAAGIRLLQIFDFEWLERREAVEGRLRALFGRGDVIGARECFLAPVAHTAAKDFMEATHTQGKGWQHKVAYGLWKGSELLACMTLGPLRSGDRVGWEIYRYASKGRVQGGFTRLLKAFIAEHKPERLTSFCDLRWSDGASYAKAGFTLAETRQPDFWFYQSERVKVVDRRTVQNPPAGMTQREFAETLGLKMVKGVGNQRWVWTPSP